ncbi:cupredoxin domain-containing protein [Candidatus Blastococcus massiliensis]|uniref:cupredoxin domain-containing protein n=1 Tax=Candidatus Blastococcus massiliensis TaxID=1470358 RepID=UPI0004BC5CE9|nr:cupredoxin domain-containing protein [Candidatus Blastococcus massiliensis]
MMRTKAVAVVVAVAATLLLAGCGSDGGSSSGNPTAAPTAGLGEVTIADDGVQEVTLQTQDDFVFTPDRFTVAPGKVRLTLVNAAREMTHNLEFDEGEGPEPIGAGIDFLAPGQELTIDFEVTVPGDHPFTCTFHTQQGQVGTMTVSQEP